MSKNRLMAILIASLVTFSIGSMINYWRLFQAKDNTLCSSFTSSPSFNLSFPIRNSHIVGNICVVSFIAICEKEYIVRLTNQFRKRNVYFIQGHTDSPTETLLCHDVNNVAELEKTNYLIVHGHNLPPHPVIANFMNHVLKKHNAYFAHTKVVNFVLGDENCKFTDRNVLDNYNTTFRNYWNSKIQKMHEKYGNIHYLPLYTCHPFLSLSNFPSLPEEIVNNEVLLQHIIDFQFSKIIPASKRKQFCYFRGQPTYERKKLEHLAPVTVLENGIETKKQLCKIEYTTGFAAGDKLSYSLFLANTAVILCPTGSNPDQFRVWESLENGAIPLPENLESFSGLPKNHPLPVVDVSRQEYHKKLESVLPELYSFTPQQLDELQRRLYNWWFRYKLEIGLKVAKALDA